MAEVANFKPRPKIGSVENDGGLNYFQINMFDSKFWRKQVKFFY